MPRPTFLLSACVALIGLALVPAPGFPAADDSNAGSLTVRTLGDSGALEILDGDRPVLRYNYRVVPEPPEIKGRIVPNNRRYAVPRSDYIHPLYGLHGEILTDDWIPDHPHHRGIYWAWPEVDWQGKRGDLHALQQVFARPTGKVHAEQGDGSVQIEAENEWMWEDRTPIVREQVVIRVYRRTEAGRPIDLRFRFTALGNDVQVARRGQTQYGGLNIRLAPVDRQEIITFTDPIGIVPRCAWAYRSGTPRGATFPVGLTILQSRLNPDYPGDWVQFPQISWLQPTFPAAGTRFTISKALPLTLHYRLWIHDKPMEPTSIKQLWAEYNQRKM